MKSKIIAATTAVFLAGSLLNGSELSKVSNQSKQAVEAIQSERAVEPQKSKDSNISKPIINFQDKHLPLLTLEQVKDLPIVKAHKFVPESIKSAGGVYMVRGYFDTPQRRMAAGMFLSENLETAVYGRGFNTQNAIEYKLFNAKSARKNTIITYGNGPQHFYIVADPHCPACKQFEKDLVKYKDTATFHIILIAIKNLHPEAEDAIRYIATLEQSKRYDALIKIADGAKPYTDMNLSSEKKAQ